MEKLVEYIAKSLVEQPDRVEVRSTHDGPDEQHIELRVAPEDRGRVIGKAGRTAHAIRVLLSASSPGQTVSLDIVD